MWCVVVILAVLLVPGCGSGDGGGHRVDGGPAPSPDAHPDADPYCHYDCFGFHECADGMVTTWEHEPVPCEYWEGECPHAVRYTCERGCRADVDQLDTNADARDMCEERRPKQVGDPCTEEAHCRPEVATVDGNTVTNVYLTCDLDDAVCVTRPPPVITDYLQPCGLVAPEPPFPSTTLRVEETAACTAGVCLYSHDSPGDCVWQGCTARCASDGECPVGTFCDAVQGEPGVCQSPDLIAAGMTCL